MAKRLTPKTVAPPLLKLHSVSISPVVSRFRARIEENSIRAGLKEAASRSPRFGAGVGIHRCACHMRRNGRRGFPSREL